MEEIGAVIKIGGTLPRSKVKEFEALLPESGNFDVIEKGERTPFYGNGSAPWGEFPELELFCQDNNLTYRRSSDTKYEYEGFTVYWEPDMDCVNYLLSNNDGQVYVTLSDLRGYAQSGSDTIADLIARLEAKTEKTIPPLVILEDE
jgi:hypothetical protein